MVSSRSCASRYLVELNEEYNLSAGSCSVKESTRDDSMAMNRDLVMCGDRQFYFLKGLHTLSGTECQWVRKKPAKVEELYLCRVRVWVYVKGRSGNVYLLLPLLLAVAFIHPVPIPWIERLISTSCIWCFPSECCLFMNQFRPFISGSSTEHNSCLVSSWVASHRLFQCSKSFWH